jgi:hypothetical protein
VLIDDRVPPFSGAQQPVWEPNWHLCAWIFAAVAFTAAAAMTAGLASFVLLCVAVACWARSATIALPYGDGLREHRQ